MTMQKKIEFMVIECDMKIFMFILFVCLVVDRCVAKHMRNQFTIELHVHTPILLLLLDSHQQQQQQRGFTSTQFVIRVHRHKFQYHVWNTNKVLILESVRICVCAWLGLTIPAVWILSMTFACEREHKRYFPTCRFCVSSTWSGMRMEWNDVMW